jgi:hypothetical protein
MLKMLVVRLFFYDICVLQDIKLKMLVVHLFSYDICVLSDIVQKHRRNGIKGILRILVLLLYIGMFWR